MFNTKIINTRKENGLTYVTIGFDHTGLAALSFVREFQVNSLELLKSQVKTQVDIATANYTLADSLAPGPLDPTPTPLSQAEIDKQQFLLDYQRWISVKRAIDLGVLTGNESPVVALFNKVKAELKPSYVDII